MSSQKILSDTPSQMPEEEFLRKLWKARSNDEGVLPGGLIKAIRTITGISDHFAKKVQNFLVERGFASKSAKGSGSAPGWKLNPAKFVEPEAQAEKPPLQKEPVSEESMPEEASELSRAERLTAVRLGYKETLDKAADGMSVAELAETIDSQHGDNPDFGRAIALLQSML